jgi:hypothetical protein
VTNGVRVVQLGRGILNLEVAPDSTLGGCAIRPQHTYGWHGGEGELPIDNSGHPPARW